MVLRHDTRGFPKLSPRCAKNERRRRGFITWLILSIAAVIAVLMFSFNLMVRQRNAQAHALYFSQVAVGLAESGGNLVWGKIRTRLEDRTSELHRLVIEKTPTELANRPIPIEIDADLKRRLIEGLDSAQLEVSSRIVSAGFLQSPDLSQGPHDPLEKTVVIEVSCRARFRGLERVSLQQRQARVQLDNLPVLSRFTLFVRSPDLETLSSPGYNRFANDINGRPDSMTPSATSNTIPLVLYNHGDTFAQITYDFEEQGWVYLGGGRPVVLNLTSGADYRFGEYFHFYNFLQSLSAEQAAFTNDAPPSFFTRPYTVAGQSHRYSIKHVIYGYFTIDQGQPPRDMNRDGLLQRYFSAGKNMRSSVLHLYGTALCPSPTKVFGPVFHSYPIFSGITVDTDGDQQRDGLVTLLPAIDEPDFPRLNTLAPIPASVRNLNRGRPPITLDSSVLSYSTIFGDFGTYDRYSSLLVEAEAYNSGIDYMTNRGQFPPRDQRLTDADYPNLGHHVTIKHRGRNAGDTRHYVGDLGDVSAALFSNRAVMQVRDAREFLAHFLRGDELILGRPVRIASGELELPRRLTVRKGGVVFCPGSIRFDGIHTLGSERLVLVSDAGDITSPFRESDEGNPAQVDLVALEGKIGSTDASRPFCVRGTVAARTFSPESFAKGGYIVFPVEADPTSPERKHIAQVHLSDSSFAWHF